TLLYHLLCRSHGPHPRPTLFPYTTLFRSTVPTPPVAKKIPKVDIVHGDRRQDDYAWLRHRDDPEVLAHLRAENAYTDLVMTPTRSEEHTSELQSRFDLVCRLLLEKKNATD